jgi:hypothetical protein
MTGFGVVAQVALPMLLEHLRVPPRNITVVDFVDHEDILRPWISRGLRFVRERVTPLNHGANPGLVSHFVKRGVLDIGSRFDPATGTWSALPTTAGAPTPRQDHSAVWTGAAMIVWGGIIGGFEYVDDGNRWRP